MLLEPLVVVVREFTGAVFLNQFALGDLQLVEEIVLGHQSLFNLPLLLIAEMPKKIVSDPRLIVVVKCHLN